MRYANGHIKLVTEEDDKKVPNCRTFLPFLVSSADLQDSVIRKNID